MLKMVCHTNTLLLNRYQDLIVMAAFHGKERTQEQWTALVARADPRLKVVSVARVKNGPLALIEVVWQPDCAEKDVAEKHCLLGCNIV